MRTRIALMLSTIILLTATKGLGQSVSPRGRYIVKDAVVVEVKHGSATLEAEDGSTNIVEPGTVIRFGDLLFPNRNAVVVVRCADESVREVRFISGLGSICKNTRSPGGSR